MGLTFDIDLASTGFCEGTLIYITGYRDDAENAGSSHTRHHVGTLYVSSPVI